MKKYLKTLKITFINKWVLWNIERTLTCNCFDFNAGMTCVFTPPFDVYPLSPSIRMKCFHCSNFTKFNFKTIFYKKHYNKKIFQDPIFMNEWWGQDDTGSRMRCLLQFFASPIGTASKIHFFILLLFSFIEFRFFLLRFFLFKFIKNYY